MHAGAQGGRHETGIKHRRRREALAGTAVLVPDAMHPAGCPATAPLRTPMPDALSEAGSLLSPRADAASISSQDAAAEEASGGARLGWQEPSRYWQDIELAAMDDDEQAHAGRCV